MQLRRKGHPLAAATGYVMEHWLVLYDATDEKGEEWLVRAKKDGWTIHHKNGKRSDNRPENLAIRAPGRHPQGWELTEMVKEVDAAREGGILPLLRVVGDHSPHKESGIVELTQTPTGTGAGCHPTRSHFAYGLCEECYKAVWYWHRNRDIEIRRRILFPVPGGTLGEGSAGLTHAANHHR